MDARPNCGSYEQEQSGGRAEGFMTIRCMKCCEVWNLESYRQEGEDRWRNPEDREERW